MITKPRHTSTTAAAPAVRPTPTFRGYLPAQDIAARSEFIHLVHIDQAVWTGMEIEAVLVQFLVGQPAAGRKEGFNHD